MSSTNPSLTKSNLNFWQKEWEKRSIGFHKDMRHPYIYIYIYINMNNNFLFKYICRMLVKHHEKLFNGRNKCKIFFPLCGKCVDMFW